MNSEVKKRSYTCIICPNGCDLEATYVQKEDGTVDVLSVTGNTCKKGEAYARQELVDPRRTIASSVLVKHGTMPLVSVRLDRPVPKKEIFQVMDAIRHITLEAPVKAGQVVIKDVLGLDSDVIATRDVERV